MAQSRSSLSLCLGKKNEPPFLNLIKHRCGIFFSFFSFLARGATEARSVLSPPPLLPATPRSLPCVERLVLKGSDTVQASQGIMSFGQRQLLFHRKEPRKSLFSGWMSRQGEVLMSIMQSWKGFLGLWSRARTADGRQSTPLLRTTSRHSLASWAQRGARNCFLLSRRLRVLDALTPSRFKRIAETFPSASPFDTCSCLTYGTVGMKRVLAWLRANISIFSRWSVLTIFGKQIDS